MIKTTKEVMVFGRYWKFGDWETRTGQLLGRRKGADHDVDMAKQSGVYVLYHGRQAVYVGKTESNALIDRLKEHNRGTKWGRWDTFSWYGFRAVDRETGELCDMERGVVSNPIDIVESVLIEVLNPYLNNQKGQFTGDMYVQVRTRTRTV